MMQQYKLVNLDVAIISARVEAGVSMCHTLMVGLER